MTENMTESQIVLEKIREMIETAEDRREKATAEVREADATLRRLRTAERAMSDTPNVAAAKAKGSRGSTREAALAIMQELRSATQFQVSERLGTRKNTARTALDQLAEQGLVVKTGEMKNRSPVFALVEAAIAE